MDLVPHLPVPLGVSSWFGDFTWSAEHGPFSEPWCQGLVPNIREATRQLELLYPRDVIERLVRTGHARLVYGLRGGFRSLVDEKLQLGADLAWCPGWHERPKLVGDLRSPHGYPRARPEVGIWAGLRRVGLEPRVEQADTPTAKRADWLVLCNGLTLAIELKTLSDPTCERDRTELWFAIAATIEAERYGRPPVAVTFRVSALIESLMGRDHVRFCLHDLQTIREEIRLVSAHIQPGNLVALPTSGELIVQPAPEGTSSYRIETGGIDIERLVGRAAHKVHEAAPQLVATHADLRVAVVLGSREWLPSYLAPHVAQKARERFPDDEVDWVVVVNEGLLNDGTWMTDAVQGARREGRQLPGQVLQGLVEWGSQSSVNS